MKKIFFIAFFLISILMINNLAHSAYTTWKKKDLLATRQKELEKQKQENQALKSELSIVGSKAFVEKEARDKLFLVKPQEQKVLLPQNLPLEDKDKPQDENTPNWQKWWKLFF